jgi:hypothetical protein
MQKQPELVSTKPDTRHPVGKQVGFMVFNIEFHPAMATRTLFVKRPGAVFPQVGGNKPIMI